MKIGMCSSNSEARKPVLVWGLSFAGFISLVKILLGACAQKIISKFWKPVRYSQESN
jgi:hypothetical protein